MFSSMWKTTIHRIQAQNMHTPVTSRTTTCRSSNKVWGRGQSKLALARLGKCAVRDSLPHQAKTRCVRAAFDSPLVQSISLDL